MVPPVVMGFSLTFGLLNLIAVVAAIPGLFGLGGRYTPVLIKGAGIALAVAVPFWLASNLSQTRTFEYFKDAFAHSAGPLAGGFSFWVVNTQPLVYPLGSLLAGALGYSAPLPSAPPSVPSPRAAPRPEDSAAAPAPGHPDHPTAGPTVSTAPADTAGPRDIFDTLRRSAGIVAPSGDAIAALSGGMREVMLHLQPLADGTWVAHERPYAGIGGSCAMAAREGLILERTNLNRWHTVKPVPCEQLDGATRGIETLDEYLRGLVESGAPPGRLHVVFHHPYTGTVECRAIEDAARRLDERVGRERWTAVVDTEPGLGCLRRMPGRDQGLLAPRYGQPTPAPERPDRVSLAEWRRLRARAKDLKGYDPHALSITGADLRHWRELTPGLRRVYLQERLASQGLLRAAAELGIILYLDRDNGRLVPVTTKRKDET